MPSKTRGKNQFQLLIEKLLPEHKARWFAGAALNKFLDSELEQILCFDTTIDTERFCSRKSAVFIVLPEEDNTKYFMVSLVVQ